MSLEPGAIRNPACREFYWGTDPETVYGPRYILEFDGSEYLDTEPMTNDDWEQWLSC